MATVQLRAECRLALITDARKRAPDECCGLLVGWSGPEGERITDVVPLQNVAAVRRSGFAIADADMIRASRAARNRGKEVIGCYHSHPIGPLIPSPTDLDRASAFSGMLHIIVGLNAHPPMRAWRTDRPRWHSVELQTGD